MRYIVRRNLATITDFGVGVGAGNAIEGAFGLAIVVGVGVGAR